jgi:phage FluMu protein gp41
MELIAHQIAIIRAIKGVIKLPKTADIITADTEKFQHKNHFYHHGENGKKIKRRNRKISSPQF